jgi:hypothetical protein
MKRQKIGQILFWLGVVCLVLSYVLFWMGNPVHRVNTIEELRGTAWATDGGFLFNIHSTLTLIGVAFPLIGLLLYSGKKGSLFWLLALVPVIIFLWGTIWTPSQYIPSIYGIGGGFIVLSYLGILWTWNKTHTAYEGIAKIGKQIQLLGYSFLLITALNLCAYIGRPNLPGQVNMPPQSGESILVAFSVGILLLFVGDYVIARSLMEAAASPQVGPRPQPSAID